MNHEQKKVLIVDDEADIVATIKFNLELEDIECIEACDGEVSLSMAKQENLDLILLDVMLPKMSGYTICRLLKFDENYKHIPIIMLTAKTQNGDESTGIATGADEYVGKPFDMDKLLGIIGGYLKE